MSKLRLAFAACILVAMVSACQSSGITEPSATMRGGANYGTVRYNGGMAGSGGSLEPAPISTATSDSTVTARNGGMAGSGG